jgi:hypothetical protein
MKLCDTSIYFITKRLSNLVSIFFFKFSKCFALQYIICVSKVLRDRSLYIVSLSSAGFKVMLFEFCIVLDNIVLCKLWSLSELGRSLISKVCRFYKETDVSSGTMLCLSLFIKNYFFHIIN